MGAEDLIPIRTKERAKELGRRGGLVKSAAKSRANSLNARVRWIKKLANEQNLDPTKKSVNIQNLSNSMKKMKDFIMDSDMAASDIYLWLKKIEPIAEKAQDQISLGKAYIDLHRQIHGHKIKADIKEELTLKGYVGFTPDDWDEEKVIDV